MTAEAKAKELHDRATRGKVLCLADQAELQVWYSKLDEAELQQLGLPVSDPGTAELQNQINATLERIAATSTQIQNLAVENEVLRRDNFLLQLLATPIKLDNFTPMTRDEMYKGQGEPR